MSFKEKLANLVFSPFTSAVDIRFSRNVEAETLYQEDYPMQQPPREVEDKSVRVETGSTMAFKITNKHNSKVRAIVVEDFRLRGNKTAKARIKEAFRRDDGSVKKIGIAQLNKLRTSTYIHGVGSFIWEQENKEIVSEK